MLYLAVVGAALARRNRIVNVFFALRPLTRPARLRRIVSLAQTSVVEAEAHPVHPEQVPTEGLAFAAGGTQ
jgi:hypothetical protein